MAAPGDRVSDRATGRRGVVVAPGRDDAINVGYTLVVWDDAPGQRDEVQDSTLAYDTFVLVRRDGGRLLYAAPDGNETPDDGREMGQRFKNEKSQFRPHELRLLRECQ
jgi:hypothetical protein